MNLILHKRSKNSPTSFLDVESNNPRTGERLTAEDLRKRAQRRWGPGQLVAVDDTGWKWRYETSGRTV